MPTFRLSGFQPKQHHRYQRNCKSYRCAIRCRTILKNGYEDGAACRLGHLGRLGLGDGRDCGCDGRRCRGGQINQGNHKPIVEVRRSTACVSAGKHHELLELEVGHIQLHSVLESMAAISIGQHLRHGCKRLGVLQNVATIIHREDEVKVHHALVHYATLHVRAEGQRAGIVSKPVICVDK